ncbi:hypothetical protein BWI96_18585 [Siphonobacter sp. SORGH_AS_0500]|uniref:carboxypeptidase-like regulatory domain-containing protein n=1 Tax=Siphonobacter sp. SORGH_AS_0500 TaxID=1864824 RepID=UPI000CCA365B|nr:carboxypeptidase-like regulatory domain-containing protein [Siphonobacter sp. SORGH_AS_0500]PKK35064.1 hypothetical protein BWI96_18585 [Siphonobacter sp. SORGH_AS_0500]
MTIEGQLVTRQNQPISDATILIQSGPGAFAEVAALTDANGKFSLSGLNQPGDYQVLVTTTVQQKSFTVHVPATSQTFVL